MYFDAFRIGGEGGPRRDTLRAAKPRARLRESFRSGFELCAPPPASARDPSREGGEVQISLGRKRMRIW